MIKIGDYEISDIFLGENTISSIFLGEYEVYSSGDWSFRAISSQGQVVGYEIAKYKGHDTIVTTPSSYKNLPVISIGTGCFYDGRNNTPSSVEQLTISNTIQRINSYAFGPQSSFGSYTNDVLTSISFEANSTLTQIADYGIYRCSALTSLTLPASLTTLGEYACVENSALTTLTLGNAITSIGASAFKGNTSLTSVNIPTSLTALPDFLFQGCSSLNNVVIPNNVEELGASCFSGCSSLDTLTLSSGITEIPASCFSGCNFADLTFLTSNITTLGNYAFNGNPLTSVTVPSSVTTIGTKCFSGSQVTTVTAADFPSVVGKFDNWFGGASNVSAAIHSIELPAGVTDVEIDYCNSLNSLNLSNGALTHITGIHHCNALRTIVVPNTVTSVDEGCFEYLWHLTSLTLSNSMTTVPSRMFYHDPGWGDGPARGNSLTTLNLGTGVTSIGSEAFRGCPDINPLIIPDQVTTIGTYAFTSSYYGNGASLTPSNVVIGANLQSVGNYAFRSLTGVSRFYYRGTPAKWCSINWGSLDSGQVLFNNNYSRADIYILDPNGDTTYSGDTYSNWNNPVIPEGVTSLGYAAFLRHVKMKSITLPASLTSIDLTSVYPSFKECKELQLITLDTTTSKDYLNNLYNFNFGTIKPVNFRIHLDLIPIVENLGWDHSRYTVIEEVLATGINSNNWPSTFEGESFKADPQYEPYYANKVVVDHDGTIVYCEGGWFQDANGNWYYDPCGGNGSTVTWASSVSDPNIASVGVGTEIIIDPSVTSPQNLTVTTFDMPYHQYECSKTISVKYVDQSISTVLSGISGNWAAVSGETVDGNQVYKNPVRSSKNSVDTMEFVFSGYTHIEIAVKCNANSNSSLYVYNLDNTTTRKLTLSYTDKYYQKAVFDAPDNGQHTVRISFNKGNTSSTDTSSLEQCGRAYVIAENCY